MICPSMIRLEVRGFPVGCKGVFIRVVFVEQEVVRFIHRAVGVIEKAAGFHRLDLNGHLLEFLRHRVTGAWFADVVRRAKTIMCVRSL
jgi:hypothetical protein